MILVINNTNEFLSFLDSIVVVQISRGFEWEDFEEDESLEGDEDEEEGE